jgi:hypothetical protein
MAEKEEKFTVELSLKGVFNQAWCTLVILALGRQIKASLVYIARHCIYIYIYIYIYINIDHSREGSQTPFF